MNPVRSTLRGRSGVCVVLLALALIGVRALPTSWPLVGQGPGIRHGHGGAPAEQAAGPPQFVAFALVAEAARPPVQLPGARAGADPRGLHAAPVAVPMAGPAHAAVVAVRQAFGGDAPLLSGIDRCRRHGVFRL